MSPNIINRQPLSNANVIDSQFASLLEGVTGCSAGRRVLDHYDSARWVLPYLGDYSHDRGFTIFSCRVFSGKAKAVPMDIVRQRYKPEERRGRASAPIVCTNDRSASRSAGWKRHTRPAAIVTLSRERQLLLVAVIGGHG
jgi:hypothetical protein